MAIRHRRNIAALALYTLGAGASGPAAWAGRPPGAVPRASGWYVGGPKITGAAKRAFIVVQDQSHPLALVGLPFDVAGKMHWINPGRRRPGSPGPELHGQDRAYRQKRF